MNTHSSFLKWDCKGTKVFYSSKCFINFFSLIFLLPYNQGLLPLNSLSDHDFNVLSPKAGAKVSAFFSSAQTF